MRAVGGVVVSGLRVVDLQVEVTLLAWVLFSGIACIDHLLDRLLIGVTSVPSWCLLLVDGYRRGGHCPLDKTIVKLSFCALQHSLKLCVFLSLFLLTNFFDPCALLETELL